MADVHVVRGTREDAPPVAEGRARPTSATWSRASLHTLAYGVIAIALLTWFLRALSLFTSPDPSFGYDFRVYYVAALALRDNPHANIFDLRVLQQVAQSHGMVMSDALYLYPPLLAVLLIPLTWLPFQSALIAWTLLTLALWLWIAAALSQLALRLIRPAHTDVMTLGARRSMTDIRLYTLAIALYLSLTYLPLWNALQFGQVTTLILLLSLLAALDSERRGAWRSALWLALAAWIKLFPLVVVGYYALRGRWRLVARTALIAGVVALALTPLLGWNGLLATGAILGNGSYMGQNEGNQSLARVPTWIALACGQPARPLAALLGDALLAGVPLVFVCAIVAQTRRQNTRGRTPSHDAEALGVSWALCTMTLIGPVTWIHTGVWLLPALVIGVVIAGKRLAARGAAFDAGEWSVLIGLVAGYVLTSLPIPYHTSGGLAPFLHGHPAHLAFLLARPLGNLALWALCGVLLLRSTATLSPVERPAPSATGAGVGASMPTIPSLRLSHVVLGVMLALPLAMTLADGLVLIYHSVL